MVQGGIRSELTTCATQADGRPIDVVRGGTVQGRPSCVSPTGPFLASFQPLSCGVRSHSVTVQRSLEPP